MTTAEPEQTYKALEKYSVDLTALAREGKIDPVIGRDAEIRRVVQVLSRRTKNNPVLIGEPGVGKTAIVEGLSQAIVKGEVPETLKGKQMYTLDLGALVAGSRLAPEAAGVWNPAFDVTPAELITAFITDAGVLRPPFGPAIAAALVSR